MSWTASDLLDHIQELIAEPVGGFYNISSRLSQLNLAQRLLVEQTRALPTSGTIAVTAGTQDYSLPADFLTFAAQDCYLTESGSTTITPLNVVTAAMLDRLIPGWQDTTITSTPTYLVQAGSSIKLVPMPDASYTLNLPYIKAPADMVELSDEPFDGDPNLNRHATALAYYVARTYMMARAPEIAQQFESLFRREQRMMRHYVRSNPQLHVGIDPLAQRR